MKEYIGYHEGYNYTETGDDYWMTAYRPLPVTICAAKCGRWWRRVEVYCRDGLCWQCWCEMFEGEEDMFL